jgi:predicted N-acetyltransferase YhbS
VTSDLRDALAADRAVRRRAAQEAIPLDAGLVVRHPELHDVHYLNAVLLDAGTPQPSAAEVAALADRWLGDLAHRHVVFDDAAAGERAAAQLTGAAWERGRTVFMGFAGDPTAVTLDGRARAISEDEMDALQLASLRDQALEIDAAGGLAARLLATQRRLRETTPACCFGAGEPSAELASTCTLFLDADVGGRRVAMLTDVATRVAHRERGLGRAVVSAAVSHAGAWGADVIVVGADADDWPQLLYAALGFDALGRQVALTHRIRRQGGAGWAGSDFMSGGV